MTHERIDLTVNGATFNANVKKLLLDDKEFWLIVQISKELSGSIHYSELTQEQRLNAILTSTNAATWEWNYQTNEVILNERWAEMLGYTLAELSPVSIQTWFKVLHPDDVDVSAQAFERHFNGVEPFYHCEVRLLNKNGEVVWVRDYGRVVTWCQNGEPEWICGTHIDITCAKELEKKLKESQETLNEAQKIAKLGYWKANFTTGELEWSEMIYELLGLDKSSVVPSISLFKSMVLPTE